MLGRGDEAHDALGPIFEPGDPARPARPPGKRSRTMAASRSRSSPSAVMHYAALGRRDERPAERGRHRRKADRLARAAVPPRARRHAEPGRGRLIGARARPEPRRIDRRGDILAGVELLREIAEPVGASIVARRRAGDLLEHAMKMKPADARRVGELGKARRSFRWCAAMRRLSRSPRHGARPTTDQPAGNACTPATLPPPPLRWSRKKRCCGATAAARCSPAGSRRRWS